MSLDRSTYNKSLASNSNSNDSILQGKELIEVLSSVIRECPVCKLKIIKMVGRNHLPTQASQQDDTQPTKFQPGEFNVYHV